MKNLHAVPFELASLRPEPHLRAVSYIAESSPWTQGPKPRDLLVSPLATRRQAVHTAFHSAEERPFESAVTLAMWMQFQGQTTETLSNLKYILCAFPPIRSKVNTAGCLFPRYVRTR